MRVQHTTQREREREQCECHRHSCGVHSEMEKKIKQNNKKIN